MLLCESPRVGNTTENGWIYETSKGPKSVTAFDSCRFNPIRSQMENVLDFRLVNVCMKESELINGSYALRLLRITGELNYTSASRKLEK